MGKLHWERHRRKPDPIKEYDLPEVNLRMVVRHRAGPPRPPLAQRYVATLRYIKPPRKGQLVKVFAYGSDPERAEIAALFAIQEKRQ